MSFFTTHLSIVIDDAVGVALLLDVELLLLIVHQIGLMSAYESTCVLGNRVTGRAVVNVVCGQFCNC